MNPLLSIIIPCYNEEEQIQSSLKLLIDYLKSKSWDVELIIANDGSVDNTVQFAKENFLMNKLENFQIVEHFPNKGRGAILKKSFQKASGQIIMYLDADMATDPCHIEDIVKIFSKKDGIVTGSRFLKRSNVDRPILREIYSRGYNSLVNLFFRDGIKDHQCGFKAIDRKSYSLLEPVIESDGWFWDTELLILAKMHFNVDVYEIPIIWKEFRGSGKSKVKIFKTMRDYISKLIWLKRKLNKMKK